MPVKKEHAIQENELNGFELYSKRILERIKKQLEQTGKTDTVFAEELGWSKAKLSRLLSGMDKVSLEKIYEIAMALKIQPEALMSNVDSPAANMERMWDSIRVQYDQKTDAPGYLLFDPKDTAFRHIMNDPDDPDDKYYFYTKPTLLEEPTGFLKGELRLIPKEAKPGRPAYCKAELKLKTGKRSISTGEEIIKAYVGEMVISLNMNTCYILLTSSRTAEINLLSFQHRFFNDGPLECVFGGCMTVSAGSTHRPTHEKFLLSRQMLDDKTDLEELNGLFEINTPTLRVPKEAVENSPRKEDIMRYLTRVGAHTQEYYIVEQRSIQGSALGNYFENDAMIRLLRNLSQEPTCVKVSNTTNDILWHYFQEKSLRS